MQICRYDNSHVGTSIEIYSHIKRTKDEENKMNRESCNFDKTGEARYSGYVVTQKSETN